MFIFFLSAKFKFEFDDRNSNSEDNCIVKIPEGTPKTINIRRIGVEQEKTVSK